MSNLKMTVDDKDVTAALGRVRMTRGNLLSIADAAALTVVNHQVIDVPKDTLATQLSIENQVIVATKDLVVEHIGPKTEYAPAIEYGRTDMPNYPIQPFVRPSVFGPNGKRVVAAANKTFIAIFLKKVKRSLSRG